MKQNDGQEQDSCQDKDPDKQILIQRKKLQVTCDGLDCLCLLFYICIDVRSKIDERLQAEENLEYLFIDDCPESVQE